MALSKEEKKALKASYKEQEKKELLLTPEQVEALFEYLEEQLGASPCDNTLKWARQWLENNVQESLREAALEEMRDMGGCCDCEILLNCYEDYDI